MADKFSYIYEDPTAVLQVTGSTPYGIYDNDSEFQTDSLNVCKFVARRLGHPIMQLEFNSGSIYATFEEAADWLPPITPWPKSNVVNVGVGSSSEDILDATKSRLFVTGVIKSSLFEPNFKATGIESVVTSFSSFISFSLTDDSAGFIFFSL